MKKKYFISFYRYYLLTVLILLIGVLSFNIVVDYTGTFGLRWIDPNITLKTDNRRLVSPGVIRTYKPDTIITGTSRVGRGINPSHNVFENKRALNLFLNAGDAYELSQLLNFALMVSPPKLVILGIDFFSFDKNLDVESYSSRFKSYNYQNNPLPIRLMNNSDLLLSKDAIKQNIASLKKRHLDFDQLKKKSFHDARSQELNVSLFDDTFNKALQVNSVIKPGGHGYHEFEFSEEKLKDLVKVLSKIKDQGIEVKLFLTPLHVYLMETIFQLNLFSQYEKIIIAMSDLSKDPLVEFYDFSGFNSVTIGLDGVNVTGNYPDAGHYSYQVGDRILEEIFHRADIKGNDFGELVTNEEVQNHLTNFKQQRLRWRSQNRRDAAIIDAIISLKREALNKEGVRQIVTDNFYEFHNLSQVQ